MADLMSQAEIDELLKSSVGGDEGESGGDEVDEVFEDTEKPVSKSKTFAAPKRKELRFSFQYQSPIFKRNQYILDPDPDKNVGDGEVV